MNGDFHFYGTGTAAMAAGLNAEEAKIVANAAEFVDYFIGDYYWSYWKIVPDDSWWPTYLFSIEYPQLTAQSSFASALGYYSDYWLAFHFPPGNKKPVPRQFSGEMAKLQDRYLSKFSLRAVKSSVKNKTQLCRPYSQFIIDMINDTVQKYRIIKTDPNWKKIIAGSISQERYISDEIPRDMFALIFLGMRMHILADSWAHQDFTGFDDKSINHIDGDVYADVNTPGNLEKAPFSAVTGVAAGFFTGGLIGGVANFDTDIVFAPLSGCGHGNLGHYPDYGWLTMKYPAAWSEGPVARNNPEQFKEAWNEIASVIAICLNKSGDVPMPDGVAQDLAARFSLSPVSISAPLQCENHWANNSGNNLRNAVRWKDKVKDPYLGVTHGLAVTRWGNVWIKNGSILHMYELAALMHFSWCQSWTKDNPDYNWIHSSPEALNVVAKGVYGIESTDNCPHIFSIGNDNTLSLNWRNPKGQWSGWMPNWDNAPKLTSVFGIETTDNCPHIFGIGTDNTLYLDWRNPQGQWSGWMANWNNAPKLSSVFGIESTDNCPHIFGIGTDNTLYLDWRNPQGQWSGWMANWDNAPKLSSVFGIETTDNCPHIFGIGADTLYLNWRNPQGQWSGWMPNWDNAPKLKSVFGIESTDNCPHIFGIGTDNTLYLNWRNRQGNWSGWMANWNNAPKLINVFGIETTDNCPHMYGIGTDNTLYLNWRNPSGQWSGWMANWNNAPKLINVFGIETTDNCPHIYGIGIDNTLYLTWRNGSGQWSSWMPNWG